MDKFRNKIIPDKKHEGKELEFRSIETSSISNKTAGRIRINFVARKSGKSCMLVLDKSADEFDKTLRQIRSKLKIRSRDTLSFIPKVLDTEFHSTSTLKESLQHLHNGDTLFVATASTG